VVIVPASGPSHGRRPGGVGPGLARSGLHHGWRKHRRRRSSRRPCLWVICTAGGGWRSSGPVLASVLLRTPRRVFG